MTDLLMDFFVTSAAIEEGRDVKQIFANTPVFVTGESARKYNNRAGRRYPGWSKEEDQFLRDNLGRMLTKDIAKHLGRTLIAVNLRWKRDLHLHAPSKHPDYYTANQAAKLIGVDTHQIAHLCDKGIIEHYVYGIRKMRVIKRVTFHRWVINTNSWIFFDWKLIPDPHLRRLCELKAERWNDEWWTTRQVADYHGVTPKDVLRLIVLRKSLPALHTPAGSRKKYDNAKWLFWYVKKSDALKAEFLRGKGAWFVKFTPRAEAWMLKAYTELGLSYKAIAQSMGHQVCRETIKKNVVRLIREQK